MIKKNKILIIICLILFIISIILPQYAYAEDIGLGDLSSYKGSNPNPENLTARVGKILGYIQVIGTIISVAMLIVIGIKYMLGSIEERAEYKKTLMPYTIGAIIIFTGTLLPQIIYNISDDIFNK